MAEPQRLKHVSSVPFLNKISLDGFWEYQYQYPSHSYQIHEDVTGDTPNERYSLGTSDMNITLEEIRSVDILSEDPRIHRQLRYKLTGGEICEKYRLDRQTTVVFQCPQDWEEIMFSGSLGWTTYSVDGIEGKKFFARIDNVVETRLCEYQTTIEMTSLCIDSGLLPRFKGAAKHDVIQCTRFE